MIDHRAYEGAHEEYRYKSFDKIYNLCIDLLGEKYQHVLKAEVKGTTVVFDNKSVRKFIQLIHYELCKGDILSQYDLDKETT